MFRESRSPAWHRDVLWTAGLVLVVAAAVTAAAVAWSRLADRDAAEPLLAATLRATLLPGEGAADAGADADASAPALAVRADAAIAPGEPFEALPGAGVLIDPTEVPTFDADAALDRIAGVWADRATRDGRAALADQVSDPALRAQVARLIDGPGAALLEAELAEEMMASGLDDGSRIANWPLQAQQSPGEPVQPIVGLFVFFDPAELQGLSDRQVGEAAVAGLADLVLDQGAGAAREAITNANLSARFEQGLSQARAALHDLFEAVLEGRRTEFETRLAEARAVGAGEADETPGLAGVLPAGELAGLPPEAANARIVDALAARTWTDGAGVLGELLAGDPRASRLGAARPALAPFTQEGRARAVRLAWTAGVVAVLAALLVAALARGAGRLARPGAALLIAAAPGAAVAWWATRLADAAAGAPLPSGARAEGAFGALAGLARYLVGVLPAGLAEDVLRVHLVLGGVGAAALLVAAAVLAGGALRPRRRGYL